MTTSLTLVGNDKELCSFCAHREYLATLQKLSQRKAEESRIVFTSHQGCIQHEAGFILVKARIADTRKRLLYVLWVSSHKWNYFLCDRKDEVVILL